MPSLLNLNTNLKSLKWGDDRPGGGDSNEPYYTVDINKIDSGINQFRFKRFDDGFIRGGAVGAVGDSLIDTYRIGKFLYTGIKGPLFIAKQVGLQLSNPKLEIRKLPESDGFLGFVGKLTNKIFDKTGIGPTRIYNLGVNTIAQIPVTAFGVHINRHGFSPRNNENTYYANVVKDNNNNGANRLVGLTTKFQLGNVDNQNSAIATLKKGRKFKQFIESITSIATQKGIDPSNLVIDNYFGGPGSTYGLGYTLIKRYDSTRTKEQGEQDKTNPYKLVQNIDYSTGLGQDNKNSIVIYGSGDIPIDEIEIKKGIDLTAIKYTTPNAKIYNELRNQIEEQQKLVKGPNQFGIYDTSKKGYSSIDIGEISYENGYGEKYTTKFTNWNKISREVRVGSGRKDLINLTPIFREGSYIYNDTVTIAGVEHNIRDLVKFAIQAIDTDNPAKSEFMVFRAYLTQFSDSVDASWNDVKYAGRGDKFYVYDGFSRKVNIGFKVAALSIEEMKPMYQKLNFLMSNLMPDYKNNLMRGPLTRLTVGNWFDAQLGIINSLSYTIPQDSPWEIAIDEPEGGIKSLILPHVIEVSLTFTPIGSETGTKGLPVDNYVSQKSTSQSNIAQNTTGKDASTLQYIE